MFKYIILCLATWLMCLCLRVMATSEPDRVCFHDTYYSSVGMCGPQLSSTLKGLCQLFGGYNKRSVDTDLAKARHLEKRHQDIFIPAKRALGFLTHKRESNWDDSGQGFGTGNIVCECCYHQCDLPELMQYCAGGGKMAKRHFVKPPRKLEISKVAQPEVEDEPETDIAYSGEEQHAFALPDLNIDVNDKIYEQQLQLQDTSQLTDDNTYQNKGHIRHHHPLITEPKKIKSKLVGDKQRRYSSLGY